MPVSQLGRQWKFSHPVWYLVAAALPPKGSRMAVTELLRWVGEKERTVGEFSAGRGVRNFGDERLYQAFGGRGRAG